MRKREKHLPKPSNQPPQPHLNKANKTPVGIQPIISWQQFSRWLMVRCPVCQNSVPTNLLPVLNGHYCQFLSVTFPISEFQLATRKNVYFFFYEADAIFSTIAHSCWGRVMLCQLRPMMSCFPLFVHCFLSILSAIKRKEKSPKLNRENLFSFFAYGVGEWAHHWEGMAANTAFTRIAFLGKRMTITDRNF